MLFMCVYQKMHELGTWYANDEVKDNEHKRVPSLFRLNCMLEEAVARASSIPLLLLMFARSLLSALLHTVLSVTGSSYGLPPPWVFSSVLQQLERGATVSVWLLLRFILTQKPSLILPLRTQPSYLCYSSLRRNSYPVDFS